jgi:hypothetical protein
VKVKGGMHEDGIWSNLAVVERKWQKNARSGEYNDSGEVDGP